MLRNRKTPEKFYASGKPAGVLFQKTLHQTKYDLLQRIENDDVRKYVETTLNDLEKQSISEDEKIKTARNIVKFFRENSALVVELSKHQDLLKAIHDEYSQPQSTQTYKAPSFLPHLVKTLSMAAFSNYAPVTAFLLGLAPAVAAATDFQIHSGVPAGGTNFCNLDLFCIQGYLTKNDSVIGQFSRNIQNTGSSKSDPTLLLLNCLNTDTIGNAYGKFLTSMPLNGTNTYIAQSAPYMGTVTVVQGSNLPSGSSQDFQNTFAPIFQKCSNNATSLSWTIAGGVLAGIAGIAAIFGAAYCIASGRCCEKKLCA